MEHVLQHRKDRPRRTFAAAPAIDAIQRRGGRPLALTLALRPRRTSSRCDILLGGLSHRDSLDRFRPRRHRGSVWHELKAAPTGEEWGKRRAEGAERERERTSGIQDREREREKGDCGCVKGLERVHLWCLSIFPILCGFSFEAFPFISQADLERLI